MAKKDIIKLFGGRQVRTVWDDKEDRWTSDNL